MEVLLDSSFIVSCIKKKIDFLAQLEEQGFKVLLPREVLQELKDLRQKCPTEERKAIDLAFQIFEKKDIKRISLGKHSVDQGLIEKGRDGYYIATIDRGIKTEIKNKVIIFSAQNRIGIE